MVVGPVITGNAVNFLNSLSTFGQGVYLLTAFQTTPLSTLALLSSVVVLEISLKTIFQNSGSDLRIESIFLGLILVSEK